MSRADDQLTQLRAARDEARARLTRRIEQTRELATPAGLTRRLQRDLTAKARSAMVQAIEIAGDNRGIVAATASAVLLWLTRQQLAAGLGTLAAKWGARNSAAPKPKDDPA